MILVRFVCQARFGKASDVVAGFKQLQEILPTAAGRHVPVRLLTDLSGAFDTVVQELELESLAEWERLRAVIFSNSEVQEAERGMPDAIASGQTEYYTIEAEW